MTKAKTKTTAQGSDEPRDEAATQDGAATADAERDAQSAVPTNPEGGAIEAGASNTATEDSALGDGGPGDADDDTIERGTDADESGQETGLSDAEADDQATPATSAGGQQRAMPAAAHAFDGAVPVGASNLADDDAPVHDSTASEDDVEAVDRDPAGVSGVGEHDAFGPVNPGDSSAEFADDGLDKGTPAYKATDAPAAGPLVPPTGFSNESGEETYGREEYDGNAGPRPGDVEVEDDSEIVGEDDEPLDADECFTDPDGIQTFCYAATRIYESYTYPNTHTRAKRLLYPEGARVGIVEADAVKARCA